MSIWNKTYSPGGSSLPTPPAGLKAVPGYYWQDAANWSTGAIPVSGADVAATLQGVANTIDQPVYLFGPERTQPFSSYKNDQTTLGHLTVRRQSGTSTVSYFIKSAETKVMGNGTIQINPQVINLQTSTGAPSITVEAGAKLYTTSNTTGGAVNTTFNPALYGAPYTYSFGATFKSSQRVDKLGEGELVIPGVTMFGAGLRVVAGTVHGWNLSNTGLSNTIIESGGRVLTTNTGKTAASSNLGYTYSGSGVYEVDLAPAVTVGTSSTTVSSPKLTLASTSVSPTFTGTFKVTSGAVLQNALPVSIASKIDVGQDGAFFYGPVSGTRVEGTVTIPYTVEGRGAFEFVGWNGEAALNLAGSWANFGGELRIVRGRLLLDAATRAAITYTGTHAQAYTGRYSAYFNPTASRAWTGWPALSLPTYENTITSFVKPEYNTVRFSVDGGLVIDESDTTININRRVLFLRFHEFTTGANSYPSSGSTYFVSSSPAFLGVRFTGTGAVTYDGRIDVREQALQVEVRAGKTATLTSTASDKVILEGFSTASSTRPLIYFGRDGDFLDSAVGGTAILDGVVQNCDIRVRDGVTLQFGANARINSLQASATITEGTIEIPSMRAWGQDTVDTGGVLGVPFAGPTPGCEFETLTATGKTATYRYVGTTEDFVLDKNFLRLGEGTNVWDAASNKAMRIKTSNVYLSGATPAAGFLLRLRGTSTAANTVENFRTSDVADKRRSPLSAIVMRKVRIQKIDSGEWTFKGDCPITGDVSILDGTIKADSPTGTSVLSTELVPNTVRLQAGAGGVRGTLRTLTGAKVAGQPQQKGRHTYEGGLELAGGVLHIGG